MTGSKFVDTNILLYAIDKTAGEKQRKSADDIHTSLGFSFWDSLIIKAALKNSCDMLYSEDMQHGELIDNRLTIINPFR